MQHLASNNSTAQGLQLLLKGRGLQQQLGTDMVEVRSQAQAWLNNACINLAVCSKPHAAISVCCLAQAAVLAHPVLS